MIAGESSQFEGHALGMYGGQRIIDGRGQGRSRALLAHHAQNIAGRHGGHFLPCMCRVQRQKRPRMEPMKQ
eukprot:scaffold36048_cov49-Attheya_sp.AAC.2